MLAVNIVTFSPTGGECRMSQSLKDRLSKPRHNVMVNITINGDGYISDAPSHWIIDSVPQGIVGIAKNHQLYQSILQGCTHAIFVDDDDDFDLDLALQCARIPDAIIRMSTARVDPTGHQWRMRYDLEDPKTMMRSILVRPFHATIFPLNEMIRLNLKFSESVNTRSDNAFNIKMLFGGGLSYLFLWNIGYYQFVDGNNVLSNRPQDNEVGMLINSITDDFKVNYKQHVYYLTNGRLMKISNDVVHPMNQLIASGKLENITSHPTLIKIAGMLVPYVGIIDTENSLFEISGIQYPLTRITTIREMLKFHNSWTLFNMIPSNYLHELRDALYQHYHEGKPISNELLDSTVAVVASWN